MLLFLFACNGEKDDSSSEAVEPPTIAWVTPKDGGMVTAGDVEASIVVDYFMLVDPAKHNEGEPTGYVEISIDGKKVKDVGAPNFTLNIPQGKHELGAELYYADGDAVTATADRVCDKGDTDPDCAEVESTISVTGQLGA
jgi:hypothetical protein